RAVGEGVGFLIEAASFAQVVASLFAYLGKRDGAQQPPEAGAIGQLELAAAGPAQEGTTGGLGNVLGTDPGSHAFAQRLVGQTMEHFAILVPELLSGVGIALAESLDQPLPVFFSLDHRLSPRKSSARDRSEFRSPSAYWPTGAKAIRFEALT